MAGAPSGLTGSAQPTTQPKTQPTSPADAARPSPPSSQAASPTETPPSSPTESASAQPTGPATEIVRGPSTGNGVALTFHGAGDPGLADQLLAAVESAGGRVTVLAVGTWLEAQPQMAARILDHGHDLGNHTYRHLTMPPLAEPVDESEIIRCADVLRRLTGTQGRWFRPSGTQHANPAILAAAGRAGYPNTLSYDVDPSDYLDPGATLVGRSRARRRRPGSIVSLHLGHAGTVQAMPHILDGLRSKGLSAVTMTTRSWPCRPRDAVGERQVMKTGARTAAVGLLAAAGLLAGCTSHQPAASPECHVDARRVGDRLAASTS